MEVKKAIKGILSYEFEYYVDYGEIEELASEYFKSKLGAEWDSFGFDDYCVRSAEILDAENQLWKRLGEFAQKRELNLNDWSIWERLIEEIFSDVDRTRFQKILKEKGLEGLVDYVSMGYDEGGFFILIRSDIINELLDAEEEKVIEKFLSGIDEKEFCRLNEEFNKLVKEHGDDYDECEAMEKVVRSFLKEQKQKEALTWLYIEESGSLQRFIQAVEEMEKSLADYLFKFNVELWAKNAINRGIGSWFRSLKI